MTLSLNSKHTRLCQSGSSVSHLSPFNRSVGAQNCYLSLKQTLSIKLGTFKPDSKIRAILLLTTFSSPSLPRSRQMLTAALSSRFCSQPPAAFIGHPAWGAVSPQVSLAVLLPLLSMFGKLLPGTWLLTANSHYASPLIYCLIYLFVHLLTHLSSH